VFRAREVGFWAKIVVATVPTIVTVSVSRVRVMKGTPARGTPLAIVPGYSDNGKVASGSRPA